MILLLDTHVFLWWRVEPHKVGPVASRAITQADDVHVSVASAWEAAIKASLGRLKLPVRFEEGISASGFRALPITFAHAERVISLPRIHGDPFDRMLVAQALTEGMTVVTNDSWISAYEVPTLSARG